MEKLQPSETENEASISSKSCDTDDKEQKNVKSNVSESKINSDEQHLKYRDDVLSDEFLADLLTRNPTSDTNSANFEGEVPKSATESVIQSTDEIVGTCTNGRDTIAECSVQSFGQNKTSDTLVAESFSCPSEKNEIEIIKEIVIEEAPQSDVLKEVIRDIKPDLW